jgi:hypothetical protein
MTVFTSLVNPRTLLTASTASLLAIAPLSGLLSFADGMLMPLRPVTGNSQPSSDFGLRSGGASAQPSGYPFSTSTGSTGGATTPVQANSGYPFYSTPAATYSTPVAANPSYYNTPNTSYNTPASTTTLTGNVSSIPAGQNFTIRLNDSVSTQTNRIGDAISATLDAPIAVGGQVLVPAGSDVMGSVTHVSDAGHFGRHGEIEIRFHSIRTPNGETLGIDGGVITNNGTSILKGDTYKMDIVKGVGIAVLGTGLGAVGGTAVGGILGVTGTGAAIGTAVGAVGGLGYATARRGKSVDLGKGTHLNIKLDHPSTIANSAANQRYGY